MKIISILLVALGLLACQNTPEGGSTEPADEETGVKPYPTVGSIERLSPALDQIIAPGTEVEILADGFDWSEGPLWIEDGGYVLFTDIPPNKIVKWKEGEGATTYLTPSGYTGEKERGGEPGANGLLLDPQGRLVMCQHGDRRVARMDAPLSDPAPKFVTLAGEYKGQRFNSPNDAAFHPNGDLYFTDPPYGLEKNVDDPDKEIPFQGVYRLRKDGTVDLLTDTLTRPNGIAFSPDRNTAYVAVSDPQKAIWVVYDVDEQGLFRNGRIFHDATDQVGKEKGLPDGLKVDRNGNIFATGPGGVWIFQPDGALLGKIHTTQATSNCAIGNNGKALYITADRYLQRVKLK